MKLREYLNKNPLVAAGIAGGAVLLGIVLVAMQLRGGSDSSNVYVPKRFFTVDDGNTYFPDTVDKIPPFTTADNKTAYRAHVVQCGKGQPFVAYLEKYSDEQKKKLEGMFKDSKTRAIALESVTGAQDTPLLKKPKTGDSGWVDPKDTAQYDAMLFRTCPGGGTPQPVFPQK